MLCILFSKFYYFLAHLNEIFSHLKKYFPVVLSLSWGWSYTHGQLEYGPYILRAVDNDASLGFTTCLSAHAHKFHVLFNNELQKRSKRQLMHLGLLLIIELSQNVTCRSVIVHGSHNFEALIMECLP